MPVTLPVPVADFLGRIPIQSCTFLLRQRHEYSSRQSGAVLVKNRGSALWSARYESGPVLLAQSVAIQAMVNALQESLSCFYGYNPLAPFPQSDPRGVTLGSASPKIASINADNKRLAVNSLPGGYVLRAGDFLAFDYGDGLRALHQVTEASATASGGGVTPQFEVAPFIRPGAATGTTVHLARPAALFRIMPDSFAMETVGSLHCQISFDAIQAIG